MISERIFSYTVDTLIEDILSDISESSADTLFLLFPRNAPLFAQKTDLQKIRDLSDSLQKDLTIVTLNFRTRKELQSMGIKTLSSLSDQEKTPFEKARAHYTPQKISYIPIEPVLPEKPSVPPSSPLHKNVSRPTLHALFIFCALVFCLFLFVVQIAVPDAYIEITPAKKEEEMHINVNLLNIDTYPEEELWKHNNGIFMIPLETVFVHKSSFTDVSKDFYGSNASGSISLINTTTEDITLKKGTRITHPQKGITIRLPEWIKVPAQGETEIPLTFPGKDIYGSMIGEKGNMEAGEKWNIPGLSEEVQQKVYGNVKTPFTGGRSGWKYRITPSDIKKAKEHWEQDALSFALQKTQAQLAQLQESNPKQEYLLLTQASDFLEIEFLEHNFDTPSEDLLNTEQGIISGNVKVRVKGYAYSFNHLKSAFYTKYQKIAPDGMSLLSLNKDLLSLRIRDISEDYTHMKASFSSRGIYAFELESQSPHTQEFFIHAKQLIVGKKASEAEDLLLNTFTEISDVSIQLSPFWVKDIPILPEKISFRITP